MNGSVHAMRVEDNEGRNEDLCEHHVGAGTPLPIKDTVTDSVANARRVQIGWSHRPEPLH
jgi:hypothetical protein